jgi:hypothetical protein
VCLHALGKNRYRKLESEQHREGTALKDIDTKANAARYKVKDTKLSSYGSGRVSADESSERGGLVGMSLLQWDYHTPLASAGWLDFTRDGRLSTYDESVLKLSKVHSGENAHA